MSVQENPEFVIILVDDNLKSVKQQIDEIEVYLLQQKGLKLKVLPDEQSGRLVDGYLENNQVELVVTDNSMENEGDGLRVIEKVRNKSDLIGILLYSAKGLKIDDYRQACIYTAVEVVDDKNFVDRLMTLIDRHLSKWDDVIFLRGIVISKVIELELSMNSFLSHYFKIPENKIGSFHDFFLENRFVSLEGKKATLSKILKVENLTQQFEGLANTIQDLQQDRNRLAHSKMHPTKRNVLLSMGEEKEYDKDEITKIIAKIGECSKKLGDLKSHITQIESLVSGQ